MAKFKVGDKVRVKEDLIVGKRYGLDSFVENMNRFRGEIVTIKKIVSDKTYKIEEDKWIWTDEMLEEVKENKTKKTFREVIADIKEGEVWVNEKAPIKFIRLRKGGVLDFNENEGINLNVMYRLQRKEYTFEEAFKAYEEEGEEIESIEYRYKKIDGIDCYCLKSDKYWCENNEGFSLDEIRGKWYIND